MYDLQNLHNLGHDLSDVRIFCPCPGCRLLLDEGMKRLESRADEILGKLGRMDRMLDAMVEGCTDCPRLFILTPATGGPTVRNCARRVLR